MEVRLNEHDDVVPRATTLRVQRSWRMGFVAVAAMTALLIAAEIGQVLWFDSLPGWVVITLALSTILLAAAVAWLATAPTRFRQRAGIAAIARHTGTPVWATRLTSHEVEKLTIVDDSEREALHNNDRHYFFAVIDQQLVFWSAAQLPRQPAFWLSPLDVERVWRDNMRPTYTYLTLRQPQPRVDVALRSTKGYWRRLVRDREDSYIAVDKWYRGVSNQ